MLLLSCKGIMVILNINISPQRVGALEHALQPLFCCRW
jgi:hypothetical protein